MGRGSRFQSRWGRSFVAPTTRFTTQDKVDLLNRIIKRANKAAGHTTTKQPFLWHYTVMYAGTCGTVTAHTRSEARARIKEALGVSKSKRLPNGIEIERGERYAG